MDTIEITPMSWVVRYNKEGIDGKTYNASFLVTHCLDGVIQVHMASSDSPRDFLKLRKEAKKYFKSVGYRKYQYTHNNKFVEEDL